MWLTGHFSSRMIRKILSKISNSWKNFVHGNECKKRMESAHEQSFFFLIKENRESFMRRESSLKGFFLF